LGLEVNTNFMEGLLSDWPSLFKSFVDSAAYFQSYSARSNSSSLVTNYNGCVVDPAKTHLLEGFKGEKHLAYLKPPAASRRHYIFMLFEDRGEETVEILPLA